jgi:hypothetical protein
MSEPSRNKYSHLPNCRADICAAGCPHAIFKHGYEAALEDSAEPELLEAVKELQIRVTDLFNRHERHTYAPNSNPEDDLDIILVSSRTAIAKAEGRE